MVALPDYLALSAVLFVIGLFGTLTKRNTIVVLMSVELMLNAVNINLVAFSRFVNPQELMGNVFAMFIIVVTAAKVGVALAIIIAMYRQKLDIDLNKFNILQW